MKRLLVPLKRIVNKVLHPLGLKMVNQWETVDYHLHEYSSYEKYKEVQIFHNKRKIEKVWADGATMDIIAEEIKKRIPKKSIKALCHGTRNGFEQNHLIELHGFEAIGTDISDNATDFPHTFEWDFHNVNDEWLDRFDLVYTNSHDQSWNPKLAIGTWLGQLNKNGYLVLEHTVAHGPKGASEMDPFGVKPTVFPYVLSEWFGHDISTSFVKCTKANNKQECWLYFIKRN